ncbi:unnamed protein product [Thlaspi arvense]|uniref:GH3 C-terminal domain-containing protein n=1 Tax=Thlaspi arvense TaxID=13288 RepID=A0AAU9RD59_THLAR|nr:unnamed protein product [Thlaspi arvense]
MLLSIGMDQTNEEYLFKALNRAKMVLDSSDLMLADFSSYADISTTPVIEDSLDDEYKYCRSNEFVGPLEIRVVNDGTFDSLMDLAISKGASVAQYKTPTCITSEKALEILEENVVARFSNIRSVSDAA